MAKKDNKRTDSKGRRLRQGEVERSSDGYYVYRWTDRTGKRHSVTANSLEKLRTKEAEIEKDRSDGIRVEATNVTVNDVYDLWCTTKRGLKDNTFQNYKYMYEMFVLPDFGKLRVKQLKKSDVKLFYNKLIDQRCLKINTLDGIHTVLHQVLEMAVEDGYMRTNVSDNVLKELKRAYNFDEDHRKALTVPEQNLFESFLAEENNQYHHWHPIFTVMLYTGMRVGEVTGLRWEDVDFKNGVIDVNHTLVYYNHSENGCYFNVHTPKTEAGHRQIPMLRKVMDAFAEEKRYQEENGIKCETVVDGYSNFIFVNRFGGVQHQGTLNKALRRIIRDCNEREISRHPKAAVILPSFSCHSLRHTFTTRLVESGVNMKVAQEVLGHKDVSTTLDIYTDVTKELAKREFDNLEEKLAENFDAMNQMSKKTLESEDQDDD